MWLVRNQALRQRHRCRCRCRCGQGNYDVFVILDQVKVFVICIRDLVRLSRALGTVRLDGFGPQDHLRRCARIFTCIVVFKHQAKVPLQACEAMAAIAAQLRPGGTGDVNAVTPVPLRVRQSTVPTCSCNGAAIKARVLIDGRAFQSVLQDRQHFGKGRGTLTVTALFLLIENQDIAASSGSALS